MDAQEMFAGFRNVRIDVHVVQGVPPNELKLHEARDVTRWAPCCTAWHIVGSYFVAIDQMEDNHVCTMNVFKPSFIYIYSR